MGGRTNTYNSLRCGAIHDINQLLRTRASADPEFNIDSDEALQWAHLQLVKANCGQIVNFLALLDVMNDPANDQVAASCRELIGNLGTRLGIDMKGKHGIPL
jgi:hypothetical protein